MPIIGRVQVVSCLALFVLVACGEEQTLESDAAIEAGVTDVPAGDAALPDATVPDARASASDGAITADSGQSVDGSSEADAGVGPQAGGRAQGELCGGIAGFRCAQGLFCNYASEAGGTGCSGIADASGTCTKVPEACAEIYQPVCSCDVHSYGNACEANAAGASVKHSGLCTAEECSARGGRPSNSNGASTPSCNAGEDSFPIPGKEAALCCVAAP